MRATALTGAKVYLWIDYLNDKNEFVGTNVEEMKTGGGDYTMLSTKGVIPQTAVFARYYVFIRSTSADGSGTLWINQASYSYN